MADIAKLGIKIDSDQAATAAQRVNQLGSAGKTTEQATVKLESSWSSFSKTLITVNQGLQLVSRVYGTIKQGAGELITAYGIQEQAEHKLTAALRATGREAEVDQRSLYKLASGLQKVTTYGDEATISAMAMLQQLANLDEEGLKRVTPGLLDFSAAMGVDLETAATLLGKTLGSSTNALSRYGIEIDTTLAPSEKLAVLTEQLELRFSGMARAMGAGALGKIEKYKNAMGDLQEAGGQLLAKFLSPAIVLLTDFATALSGSVIQLETAAASWEGYFKEELVKAVEEGTLSAAQAFKMGLSSMVDLKGFAEIGAESLADLELINSRLEESAVAMGAVQKELGLIADPTMREKLDAHIISLGKWRDGIVAIGASAPELQSFLNMLIDWRDNLVDLGDAVKADVSIPFTGLMDLLPAATGEFRMFINENGEAETMLGGVALAAQLTANTIEYLSGFVTNYGDDADKATFATDQWKNALSEVAEEMATVRIESGEMKEYIESEEKLAESLERIGENAFWQGIGLAVDSFHELGSELATAEDGMKSFGDVVGGLALKMMDLTAGVLLSIAQSIALTNPWMALGLVAVATGMSFYSGAVEGTMNASRNAQGNVYDGGNIIPFSRGAAFTNAIIDQPTLFPMAQGMGLMGEAGAEAIMPLTRTASGDLGVKSTGNQLIVNIENYAGDQVTAKREQTPDGDVLRVIIQAAVRDGFSKGDFDGSMRQNYNLARKGIA